MQSSAFFIDPKELLDFYKRGAYPMAPEKESDYVYLQECLDKRGIIPLDNFKVSKNIRRAIRNISHQCFINRDFLAVIKACGSREETWISDIIINSYCVLHKLGYAHSVEIYNEIGELVGGLYGVSLGSAFMGESMFKFAPDMDKFAMYYCAQILKNNGFVLWDTQNYTKHLGTMGAIEITGEKYLKLLDVALNSTSIFDIYNQPQVLF